ncbi:ABC transporter substrate-binding protein [Amycolatopsis carbonis]|uniref:ABC transporter substrate-binding protein n=1 Tax=Amycolatopsis carbonis TaxID=715471 RepID=A0A9Y2IDM5_9PSEU|nr:ABC transporter substrate-binding protein [Amycolatopsis sp. 2-15]WIX77569.1 ABC transporter substrate-binding protein [Amycolatopsis sp. 2-15]
MSAPSSRRRRTALVVGAIAALTVSLTAACGSGDAATGTGDKLPTSADGTPNLKGTTIRIVTGAAPAIEDTKIALVAQVLKSWGADATIVNQTGDPSAIRVLLAGDADIGTLAVSSSINSGLKIFGPSQPRLDYHFLGAPSLNSMKDLPGHVYGTSNVHGVEALMFADLLAKNNIDPKAVTTTVAGGASVRVSAMLTHHIDATFAHATDVSKLTSAGFHDLVTMSKTAPELADSFLATSPQWLASHGALAVAIDQAWIKAAQIFNTDKDQWVKAAVAYAKADEKEASSTYDALKAADTFPASKDAYSEASAKVQEDLANKVGAITKAPATSDWVDTATWDKATAAMKLT